MRFGVDVAFNIVREGGGSDLRGLVTPEAMLVRVQGAESDTLVDMPGAQPLQGFKKIVGEGDGEV